MAVAIDYPYSHRGTQPEHFSCRSLSHLRLYSWIRQAIHLENKWFPSPTSLRPSEVSSHSHLSTVSLVRPVLHPLQGAITLRYYTTFSFSRTGVSSRSALRVPIPLVSHYWNSIFLSAGLSSAGAHKNDTGV
jgi:hypothetical protein